MNVVPVGSAASGGFEPFVLSVVHGVVLTLILVGLFRVRWLIFANIVIGLVAAFFLFLLVDGLVSGSLSAAAGLFCGAVLTIAGVALYGRMHRKGHEPG